MNNLGMGTSRVIIARVIALLAYTILQNFNLFVR